MKLLLRIFKINCFGVRIKTAKEREEEAEKKKKINKKNDLP